MDETSDKMTREETDKIMAESRFELLRKSHWALVDSHEALLKAHNVLATQVTGLIRAAKVCPEELEGGIMPDWQADGRTSSRQAEGITSSRQAEGRTSSRQADGRTEVIVNTYDRVLALEAEVERLTENAERITEMSLVTLKLVKF